MKNDTSTPQPTLADIVRAEIASLRDTSLQYRKIIDTAKTNYKKQYYMKKLKKNNKKLMEMLIALDRLPTSTATNKQ